MGIYDHVIIFLPPRNNVTKLSISVWTDLSGHQACKNDDGRDF